jgi:hypothetical protein
MLFPLQSKTMYLMRGRSNLAMGYHGSLTLGQHSKQPKLVVAQQQDCGNNIAAGSSLTSCIFGFSDRNAMDSVMTWMMAQADTIYTPVVFRTYWVRPCTYVMSTTDIGKVGRRRSGGSTASTSNRANDVVDNDIFSAGLCMTDISVESMTFAEAQTMAFMNNTRIALVDAVKVDALANHYSSSASSSNTKKLTTMTMPAPAPGTIESVLLVRASVLPVMAPARIAGVGLDGIGVFRKHYEALFSSIADINSSSSSSFNLPDFDLKDDCMDGRPNPKASSGKTMSATPTTRLLRPRLGRRSNVNNNGNSSSKNTGGGLDPPHAKKKAGAGDKNKANDHDEKNENDDEEDCDDTSM